MHKDTKKCSWRMPVYWWVELKRLNELTGLKDALINDLPQDA